MSSRVIRTRTKISSTVTPDKHNDPSKPVASPRKDTAVAKFVNLRSFARKPPNVLKSQGSKTPAEVSEVATERDPLESLAKQVESKTEDCINPNLAAKEVDTNGSQDDIEDVVGKKLKWVPAHWETMLQHIQTMRADRTAPVDTMGCERTMEENVGPKVRRYQTLVSLMLSSQTKDEVTFAAMGRLKEHGLTIQNILDIDEAALGKMLVPVGFWKKKASYIKRATLILREQYNDDIPDTIEALCKLPGVGPKMGYIALAVAWGKHSGIGVDTHVHRISNRLGWTGLKETKTPEQTRVAVESWLPEELWPDFNILLVGFGQTVCTPVNPKCSKCLANNVCPYGKNEMKSKSKSKR